MKNGIMEIGRERQRSGIQERGIEERKKEGME